VSGRVIDAVRDPQHRTLIPRNAVVTGRIVQIYHFYQPIAALRVKLRLETVEIAGVSRALAAEPDTTPPPPIMASARTSLQPRPIPMMVDNQDRHVAVLTFTNSKGSLTIPPTFEWKWFTTSQ
jgi:hypothetical protein